MFQNIFKSSDELEVIDVLMRFYKKVKDAEKFIESACKKLSDTRDAAKLKGESRETLDAFDRKLAYLWYSLGRVYLNKGSTTVALPHLKNLEKLLDKKGELWKHDPELLSHMKAKANLQLGVTKLAIAQKNNTLKPAKNPVPAGTKTELLATDHFVFALVAWKDLFEQTDKNLKDLNTKYGLKELDYTKGEESKENVNYNDIIEQKLNEKEKEELKTLKFKNERYAIYITNSFYWLSKYGFLIDENPKEMLRNAVGPGTRNDAMKDMLDKIVDAVAENKKLDPQNQNMDYSIQKICLETLKSNFKSIPSMTDLQEVFSGKQSVDAQKEKKKDS
jgi:hypothetical protein